MSTSEIVAIVISGSALVISIVSLLISAKHNKKLLEQNELALSLEKMKVFSELGTLEDITRKKNLLKIEHNEKRREIIRKCGETVKRNAARFAVQGILRSSTAENAKRETEKAKERELEEEDKDFMSKMKDLESKEKLIKENDAKQIK